MSSEIYSFLHTTLLRAWRSLTTAWSCISRVLTSSYVSPMPKSVDNCVAEVDEIVSTVTEVIWPRACVLIDVNQDLEEVAVKECVDFLVENLLDEKLASEEKGEYHDERATTPPDACSAPTEVREEDKEEIALCDRSDVGVAGARSSSDEITGNQIEVSERVSSYRYSIEMPELNERDAYGFTAPPKIDPTFDPDWEDFIRRDAERTAAFHADMTALEKDHAELLKRAIRLRTKLGKAHSTEQATSATKRTPIAPTFARRSKSIFAPSASSKSAKIHPVNLPSANKQRAETIARDRVCNACSGSYTSSFGHLEEYFALSPDCPFDKMIRMDFRRLDLAKTAAFCCDEERYNLRQLARAYCVYNGGKIPYDRGVFRKCKHALKVQEGDLAAALVQLTQVSKKKTIQWK